MLGQQDECGNRFQELGLVEEHAEVNSAEYACLVFVSWAMEKVMEAGLLHCTTNLACWGCGHTLYPSPLRALKSFFFNFGSGFWHCKTNAGKYCASPSNLPALPYKLFPCSATPAITDLHSPPTKALYDPAIVCGGRRAWRARERAKATASRRSEGHRAHEEKRGWGGGVDGAARPGLLQHSVGHRAMWAELQVVVGVLASAEQRSVAGLGHVEDQTVSVCMPRGREDGAAGPLRVAYCGIRPWARQRRIPESNNGAWVVAGVSSYGTGTALRNAREQGRRGGCDYGGYVRRCTSFPTWGSLEIDFCTACAEEDEDGSEESGDVKQGRHSVIPATEMAKSTTIKSRAESYSRALQQQSAQDSFQAIPAHISWSAGGQVLNTMVRQPAVSVTVTTKFPSWVLPLLHTYFWAICKLRVINLISEYKGAIPVPALERVHPDKAPPVGVQRRWAETLIVPRAVVPQLHRVLPPLAPTRERDEGEAVRAHGEEAAGLFDQADVRGLEVGELVHRGGVRDFGEDGGELRVGLKEDEGVVLVRVPEYVEYHHTI
ncbi:hypothetical protein B0H14DRAFT_2611267 [Mycena olivaceomarginata]|nr:hypothetical protein B0H14DRAFT_2611267 [Mycena olivaceomarginata]